MENIKAPKWGEITKSRRFDAKLQKMHRNNKILGAISGFLTIVIIFYVMYTIKNAVEYFFG